MKNNITYKINAILVLLLVVTACEKLDLAPENQFTSLNYWTSIGKAQTVLNTAYSQMQYSNYFFYNEALSDNAYNGRGDMVGAASLAAGTYDASLSRLQNEWNQRYAGIKTCNLFLENIDRIEDADADVVERMIGEARFIRAFHHFQLMTWFGDVPLVAKDLTIEDAQTLSRTPRTEVLQFVLSELDEVIKILPSNSEYSEEERGKITKGAAIALKARVLLYENDWEGVVAACESLMDGSNGSYGLFSSYEGLFLPQNEYSNEDILSLQYLPEFRTWGEYFDFAPLTAGSRLNAMAATQELVDSYLTLDGKKISDASSGYNEDDPYTNRDPRLTNTIVYHGYEWEDVGGGSHTVLIEPGSGTADEYVPGSSATPTGYYWRKYFDPTHQTGLSSGLNLMLIRYADVLLMYAEAKTELGQMDQATWDNTIKAIRSRAGFTNPTALNFDNSLGKDELRQIIRNERRVELAFEGLRIFDIRRWKTAEDVLNGWAHGAKFGPLSQDDGYIRANLRFFDPNKHYLWPIPRDERLINPNLSQNPGW
ncbi:RagB/SusD family nutrient uptake outer membrane protein [Maribacter polysiphoniae]|uniref:Putative outer membrane starch-binding protein n=1 Tax=Maribacter polysiphoniae TaxID=429344 RepID=A0A316DVN3_9FLAO|nr:RagB/SusD family nutrient uptake outer membrane protein [Maribacter polysiphoniae]MBD1262135.1 RagB/SusD family nutrient uptake outer membrane protein [Maribacter polysiphoniae]PWK21826.1 putative outer membrane starch-binding protein [Maribacter polysiphoniae]